MKPKDPQAFPNAYESSIHKGMTLRDYFAAKAMPHVFAQFSIGLRNNEYGCPEGWEEGVAIDSYKIADAMLKERAK